MNENSILKKMWSGLSDTASMVWNSLYSYKGVGHSQKEIEYFEELRERKRRNRVASKQIVIISGKAKKKKPKRFIYRGSRLKYRYDWDRSMRDHGK